MEIKTKDIYNALHICYGNNVNYKIDNVFLFHDWESDFVVVKSNGYVYEFEVKQSRADFFRDFEKKEKHEILQHGKYERKVYGSHTTVKEVSFRPNRFYYVVPHGLINRHEVPLYAGLITVNDSHSVSKIREAKLLHKNVIDVEKKLCRKFYAKWLDARYSLMIKGIEPKSTGEVPEEYFNEPINEEQE